MNLEEPLPSDCCGSGCSPCVFDVYRQRLQDLQNTFHHSSENKRTDLLSETRFKPFKLLEKNEIVESVFQFRFQPVTTSKKNRSDEEVEINGTLPYSEGQHLLLRCPLKEPFESEIQSTSRVSSGKKSDSEIVSMSNNDSEKRIVIRAYTPITLATKEKNCCFNIFVKLYKKGIASELFENSSVGDIFYWRGPYGSYQYKHNSFSHILMLSVGTGLAPMISVINTILDNESDETIVHLKCGFRNINHVIFRKDLKNMAHFWNCSIEYYFSDVTECNHNTQFGEKRNTCRLDKSAVESYIKNKSIAALQVLICGTEQFTCEMKRTIEELNNVNVNMHVF